MYALKNKDPFSSYGDTFHQSFLSTILPPHIVESISEIYFGLNRPALINCSTICCTEHAWCWNFHGSKLLLFSFTVREAQ